MLSFIVADMIFMNDSVYKSKYEYILGHVYTRINPSDQLQPVCQFYPRTAVAQTHLHAYSWRPLLQNGAHVGTRVISGGWGWLPPEIRPTGVGTLGESERLSLSGGGQCGSVENRPSY